MYSVPSFLNHIRAFNNAFALTSLGVKYDKSLLHGPGIQVFHIQGQLCHLIGSLLPAPNDEPKFAQILITESDQAAQVHRRSAVTDNTLNTQILMVLQQLLEDHNPYYAMYSTAWERLQETGVPLYLKITPVERPGSDLRRYNIPTAPELGVILEGDGTEINSGRDTVVAHRGGPLKRVSDLHPSYNPLQFPLLLPRGEQGFRLGIPLSERHTTTVMGSDLVDGTTQCHYSNF